MHKCPHIQKYVQDMCEKSSSFSRKLPIRCSTLVPVIRGSELVDQIHPSYLAFFLWSSSCEYDSSPVHWQSTSNISIREFSQALSYLRVTILPSVASLYPRLFCFGYECPVLKKNPAPRYVLSHHVSLDFSDVLVVPDQYFQQSVSPVQLVSNLTKLLSTVNNSSRKIRFSHSYSDNASVKKGRL